MSNTTAAQPTAGEHKAKSRNTAPHGPAPAPGSELHKASRDASTEAAAVWVPVAELKAWQANPRKNDRAVPEVAASIRRFGFASPIIARPCGEVIAGHTRLKAALELRMHSVPVRFLDLSDQEAHALALADNKIGEISRWDRDGLGAVLADLELDGVSLDGLGWTDEEIANLCEPAPIRPAPMADDDAPHSEPATADSVPFEVYALGAHALTCGPNDPASCDAIRRQWTGYARAMGIEPGAGALD